MTSAGNNYIIGPDGIGRYVPMTPEDEAQRVIDASKPPRVRTPEDKLTSLLRAFGLTKQELKDLLK